MAQLNFTANFPMILGQNNLAITRYASLNIAAINLSGSLSWGTINLAFSAAAGSASNSIYIGLYSLTGNTLSLANSISGNTTMNAYRGYVSLTAVSATQNITPGTWYYGLLISNGTLRTANLYGGGNIGPENAFPGLFIFGRMTATTAALPASIATSDLDITGSDAYPPPYIILSG